MTKFGEMADKQAKLAQAYADELSEYLRQARQSSWQRVMTYLFALNAGSLLGSLTYVASEKTLTSDMRTAISFFALGFILLYVHAAIDYYASEFRLKDGTRYLQDFYRSTLDWEALLDKVETRRTYDTLLHCLGWGSAICGFSGLIFGVCAILDV